MSPARSPIPLAAALAYRQFRFWLTDYRRTWRGSIYSSVLNPMLYLGAMGLGLGKLVDQHGTAHLGGVSYLMFLAPGLLAAQAMQTGIGECTYPVLGSVKWNRTYQAAVGLAAASRRHLARASALRGHAAADELRAVLRGDGGVRRGALAGGVAGLPAAMLTGLAFAAPVEAWAITQNKDTCFSVMFRFVLIPLFLFSGTFFPITQLPAWLRPVAYATPLWHGVALCRGLSLGTLTAGDASCTSATWPGSPSPAWPSAGYTYRRRLHA